MTSTTRTQRRYDHRLREMVCNSKNIHAAVGCGVPRSTARGWLAPRAVPVVTLPAANHDHIHLQQQVLFLRRRLDRLVSLLRLMTLLLQVAGFSLARVRLPEGPAKTRLLRAIDRSRAHFTLRAVLRIVGLSRTRYHAWSNEAPCSLADQTSCPRRSTINCVACRYCLAIQALDRRYRQHALADSICWYFFRPRESNSNATANTVEACHARLSLEPEGL